MIELKKHFARFLAHLFAHQTKSTEALGEHEIIEDRHDGHDGQSGSVADVEMEPGLGC